MGIQIAVGTGSGVLFDQPPDQREVGVEDPVLQVDRAPVIDLADLSLIDELPGQGHSGDPAIVEGDHVPDLRLLDRIQHLLCFRKGIGERLLAEHVFPCLGSGHGDVPVRIPRGGDIHQVDVIPLDQTLPGGFVALPAELRGCGRDLGFVPAANGLHDRKGPGIEEH